MKARIDELLQQIWGFNKLYIDYKEIKNLSAQTAAIILATNPQNYERFASLDSFKELFKNLDLELNLYNLELLQSSAIFNVNALKIKRAELLEALKILSKENLCEFSHFEKISTFLNELKLKDLATSAQLNTSFLQNLASLNEIYKSLCEYFKISKQKSLYQRLENAEQNANNSRFYVAITGVINAGKSSTLNALMGQNILGVSNIPETASISVLSYAKQKHAKIEFLDKSLQELMGLEIKDLSELSVSLDELKNYTGANSALARYIKQSEIFLDLEILKDGLSIVDTPGLDDAVIWREELTKSYINKCDYILHLMNAAQASSKKDMLFICEVLQNAKSSEFGVVLTHIDELDQTELKSALEYTKQSIKTELKECGFDESLANKVHYFKLSAPKNIGINELKAHLYESFFGQNSKKASIILQNYKKELGLIISSLINEASQSLSALISQNKDDNINSLLAKQNAILNAKNQINAKLENIFNDLAKQIEQKSEISSICANLAGRVIADIKYTKDKKSKINFDRINIICASGINDMLLDLLRDSRAKLDLGAVFDDIKLRFNLTNLPDLSFNAREYLQKNAPRPSFNDLNNTLKNAIKNESDLSKLNLNIQNLLNDFISTLNPLKLVSDLLKICVDELKNSTNLAINSIQQNLNEQSSQLQTLLDQAKEDKAKLKELKENKENELEFLQNLLTRLKEC